MKKVLALGALSIILAAGFTSCKKYEDGPAISFRSKKARVVNTWRYTFYQENSENRTDLHQQDRLNLAADGSVTYSWQVTSASGKTEYYQNRGNWEFWENNEKLRLKMPDASGTIQATDYTITQLRENYMDLKSNDGLVIMKMKSANR